MIQKRHGEFFFIFSAFDKHDNVQFLAKFEKKLKVGFRATINF